MFGRNKTSGPATHRLPKMQKILSEGDLQFVLSEAASRRGTTIEMPFITGQSTYMLTVLMTQDSYEPTWTYYRGDDAQAQLLWRHPTGDVNLVLTLCAGETGQGDPGYMATGKSAGQPQAQSGGQMLPPATDLAAITYPTVGQAGANNATVSRITHANINKQATLEGDLSNMQIPTLLQSINMSKMTGRLMLEDGTHQAYVYFIEGTPTHAATDEGTGDQAIVEMITWEAGSFHFYPNERTGEKTVTKRVDSLLMEGVTLLDQHKYIVEHGVKPQCYLYRKNDRLTEAEFKVSLAKGAPIDIELQKRFYSAIENGCSLTDLLRRTALTRNEWVPLMFNMLTCGLVVVSDTPPQAVSIAPMLAVPSFDIDRTAIQGVARSLSRPETGIFTYPAFLFFLELEFAKCASMGLPLSLVVFELSVRNGNDVQPLQQNLVREVMKRLEQAKRPFDFLGHFEMFQYALFLPNTPSKGAKIFALRLLEMLAQNASVPREMGQLHITMGIACAPEDTMDMGPLLSAAREARKAGANTGANVTLFRDLQQR